MSAQESVTSASWRSYPSAIDFGSVYLCADARGVVFRRTLTAGHAGDSPYWPQVSWVLKVTDIPKPPVTAEIHNLERTDA